MNVKLFALTGLTLVAVSAGADVDLWDQQIGAPGSPYSGTGAPLDNGVHRRAQHDPSTVRR